MGEGVGCPEMKRRGEEKLLFEGVRRTDLEGLGGVREGGPTVGIGGRMTPENV